MELPCGGASSLIASRTFVDMARQQSLAGTGQDGCRLALFGFREDPVRIAHPVVSSLGRAFRDGQTQSKLFFLRQDLHFWKSSYREH